MYYARQFCTSYNKVEERIIAECVKLIMNISQVHLKSFRQNGLDGGGYICTDTIFVTSASPVAMSFDMLMCLAATPDMIKMCNAAIRILMRQEEFCTTCTCYFGLRGQQFEASQAKPNFVVAWNMSFSCVKYNG